MSPFVIDDYVRIQQEELRAQAAAVGRSRHSTDPAMELFVFCVLVVEVIFLIAAFLSLFAGRS